MAPLILGSIRGITASETVSQIIPRPETFWIMSHSPVWVEKVQLSLSCCCDATCWFSPSRERGEKTGPEHDHGHIFQSLGAGPPPQRDSPCVGCGDLSQREQANSSARAHIRPPSAARTGRVTLRSSASTFSISLRVTEIRRHKSLLCKFLLCIAETFCHIPHFCPCDAVPSYLLEGYILSGFKSAQ